MTDHIHRLSDEHLRTIAELAAQLARQLIRTHGGFNRSDLDDLVQELLHAVVQSMDRFNSERSSLATFVDRIMKNRRTTLVRQRQAECRHWRRERPLNESAWDSRSSPLTDRLEERSGRQHTGHDSRNGTKTTEMKADVERILEIVERDHRLYADLRMNGRNHAEASQELGASRRKADRLRADLLRLFEAEGLEEYL